METAHATPGGECEVIGGFRGDLKVRVGERSE
jgi:hypothetical protein